MIATLIPLLEAETHKMYLFEMISFVNICGIVLFPFQVIICECGINIELFYLIIAVVFLS